MQAFKQFFESFYPSLCILAKKYIKDNDLAEDFAQEAFIEFWQRKEEFQNIRSAKGYLYIVARNKCLNHNKIQNIRENILKNNGISPGEYFYELIFEEETYRIVHSAIKTLA
ncbi:MAG: sigma-70 family RNA polymerase sigma factor, partial [Victivallales bacterium]|nr:sigma-70 family RNA polymerase sigma factor [Victivallales bacterium]